MTLLRQVLSASSLWRFCAGKTFALKKRFHQFDQTWAVHTPAGRDPTEIEITDGTGNRDGSQVNRIRFQRTVRQIAFQQIQTAGDLLPLA